MYLSLSSFKKFIGYFILLCDKLHLKNVTHHRVQISEVTTSAEANLATLAHWSAHLAIHLSMRRTLSSRANLMAQATVQRGPKILNASKAVGHCSCQFSEQQGVLV